MSAATPGRGPLVGRRILVTRAREQADRFAGLLRDYGAEVLLVPIIRFEPPDSWAVADGAIDRLGSYGLVIFTSVNGVTAFLRRLEERGGDAGQLRASLAAIGPRTAEALHRRGLRVDVLPDSFRAEGIVEALEERNLEGEEVLIPRAQEARGLLVTELRKRGARVTVAPVYRTVGAEEGREALIRAIAAREVDVVTFTASSTVHHLVDLLSDAGGPHLLSGLKIACIGPVTADAVRARGLEPDILPDRYTIPDLAEAIARYFTGPQHSAPDPPAP